MKSRIRLSSADRLRLRHTRLAQNFAYAKIKDFLTQRERESRKRGFRCFSAHSAVGPVSLSGSIIDKRQTTELWANFESALYSMNIIHSKGIWFIKLKFKISSAEENFAKMMNLVLVNVFFWQQDDMKILRTLNRSLLLQKMQSLLWLRVTVEISSGYVLL